MKWTPYLVLFVGLGCASQKETRGDEDDLSPPPDVAPTVKRVVGGPSTPTKASGEYPTSRVEKVEDTIFGVTVADPYRWLEDEKAPEVQEWMKAQDRVARARLAELPGRDALAKRFRELFYVESVSTPVKRKNRFFYLRTHADKEKAILYVREGEQGPERVLLDPNGWGKDGNVSLGGWVPSWDGTHVVFQEKPNAADEATLHVVDVRTGEWSKVDVIPGAKYASPSWTPDGKAFYYEWLPTDPQIPTADRPGYTEARLHRLGTDPKGDVTVHPATHDPATFLRAQLTRDGKYLFVSIWRGWNEDDVYFKELKKDRDFRLLVKGKDAKYEVAEWKDNLYILTDEGAPRQRILKVSLKNPDRKEWREIVPEDPNASLDDLAIIGNHLVLSYLRNASSELRVATLEGKPVRTLSLPAIGSVATTLGLEDEDEAFFQFSSITIPRQVYKTSIRSGAVKLWAKVELPIDPTPYTVEQVFYPSKDGTKISMFLVHRKDLVKDGSHPVLLYGYGGFNISMTPLFRSSIYPWLEAGGVYAVPNLRGGGEYGKAWHDAGKQHNKQNVFDDFIAAAEFLVKEGYTQPKKLAINGGSNGGLLVGAAMVQRPDLFGAVVCAVPLLDMVRYHRFGSGKTWIPEYGTADDAEDFQVLYAYSPYHRVKVGALYPPLLMLSADHDDRVDPMHARKFIAAVQNAKVGPNPAILRIEMNAGHGGADQVKQAVDQYADQYGFLFQTFGMGPAR